MEIGTGQKARKERWERARRGCEQIVDDHAETGPSAFSEVELAQDFAHLQVEERWGEDALDKIITSLSIADTSSFEIKRRRILASGASRNKRRSARIEQRAA